ncbi:collectin-10 isoform X1 [Phyllopteryx taeniolatus]|uniref:collectin-10 isoform X1 n=1 Tax=Phyllopteryx taeniolatus TaxID=161469 RepID=UPI002AD4DDC6|nr:collectin-10 isoform X1 [Phyllopteryx taeniolatus]
MARHSSGLFLFCAAAAFAYVSSSAEVCSHSLIPGAKGDQGEIGNEGDEGRIGKNGPPGHPGASGEAGMKGDNGHMGKTGPSGDQGDKGATGLDGPSGLKGKAGTTCDCGKYRRVVGQMDVNVGKLRNGVKFVKNIMLGLTESEERYYLLVKEAKSYKEASMNCKLRGGTLAVPNTVDSNRLMADYVSQSGLTRVYVGLLPNNTDTLSVLALPVWEDAHQWIFPIYSSAQWKKQFPGCRFQPTSRLCCMESRRGAHFTQPQRELCGAAQHRDMESCGV